MRCEVLGWDSEIADKSFAANGELEVFNIAGKNDSLVRAWNWYAFLETYLNFCQFDWMKRRLLRCGAVRKWRRCPATRTRDPSPDWERGS